MSDQTSLPVALIVGGSTGLGAALATKLAGKYQLILLGSNQARLEEYDDTLREAGYSATLVPMDISSAKDIDAMLLGLWQRFGRLDLLCGFAAWVTEASPIAHLSNIDMDKMLAVNLNAHFRFLRTADSLLRQSKSARVMMACGGLTYDNSPNAFLAGFDATKAALAQLTRQYSLELNQTSVKAHCVYPAAFDSRLRRRVYPGQPSETLSSAENQAEQLHAYILRDDVPNGQDIILQK